MGINLYCLIYMTIQLEIFLQLNYHWIHILEIQVVYSPPMRIWAKSCHSFFFTLEIIRTLLQPRRSFVLVGWSFLEGTSHFLVVCADRLTTLVLEKKKTRRTARRSPNHRSHYSFAATA